MDPRVPGVKETVWSGIVDPSVQHLTIESGGLRYHSQSQGGINTYISNNSSDVVTMIKSMMNMNQSSLKSLTISNIDQAVIEPLSRMLHHPKVSFYYQGIKVSVIVP